MTTFRIEADRFLPAPRMVAASGQRQPRSGRLPSRTVNHRSSNDGIEYSNGVEAAAASSVSAAQFRCEPAAKARPATAKARGGERDARCHASGHQPRASGNRKRAGAARGRTRRNGIMVWRLESGGRYQPRAAGPGRAPACLPGCRAPPAGCCRGKRGQPRTGSRLRAPLPHAVGVGSTTLLPPTH
jgi:hypothetical protein